MAEFVPAFEKMIRYEPESGLMYWLVPRGVTISAGDRVQGSLRPDGYVAVSIDGVSVLAHRLAWRLAFGSFPQAQIDHVNGDRSDNRLANLREATASQNQWNKTRQSNNTSGFKGVSLHRKSGLFRARLKVDRKEVSIGYYKTPLEAHRALVAARAMLHKDFARF